MIRIDISESFPMLLSRRVPWKSVVTEFIFFLNGFTNNNWLRERNCKYWEEFAHPETGELGPVYGAQLRNFNNQGVDQLALLIDGLQNRPNSRRHMFTYFNPAVVPDETKTHKENIESIPASVRGLVLINQMKQENSLTLVEDYVNAYVTTNDSNFRRQLTQAVSYLKNQEGLDYVLSQLKDKHVVKPQDLYLWYMNFLSKSFAQETVWNWAKDNWDWIKAALGGDMSFDSFVIFPSHIFKTEEELSKAKETGLLQKINDCHKKLLHEKEYPGEGIKDCTFASQEDCDKEWNGNWYYYYK